MSMTKYIMTGILAVVVLANQSKLPKHYEAATMGATLGGVAGILISSSGPLGLIGGLAVGGLVGHQMDSQAKAGE